MDLTEGHVGTDDYTETGSNSNVENGAAVLNQLIEQNNIKLLTSIDSLVNVKIDSLKRTMNDDNDNRMVEIKKLKFADGYKFKRKGNEESYVFNESVEAAFNEADRHVKNNRIEKVKQSIEKGLSLINNRQKIIILADKSKHGWASVNEYVRDEILEDSEDEKRWKRAEASASKIANEKRSGLRTKSYSYAQRRGRAPPPPPPPPPLPSLPFRPATSQKFSRGASGVPGPPVLRGSCFKCGLMGHWRVQCPYLEYKQMSNSVHVNNIVSEVREVDERIVFKGRLRQNLIFWNEITTSQVVLNIVKNGYPLPFVYYPLPKFMSNNKSSLEHKDFVESSIKELLDIGSIEKCENVPTVVNPLTVSVNDEGKKRLILDLRYVNEAIVKSKFKCEDLRTAQDMLLPRDFMFKFDLKSGYHHIEIAEQSREYLGFSWTNGGEVSYYTFSVLPFGLSSAPLVFTKMLRPLVAKWRGEGKRIVLYLDDGLCMCEDVFIGEKQAEDVKTDLVSAGFVPNEQKSEWAPKQVITWLGIVINALLCKFFVTPRRVGNLKSAIARVSVQERVPVKQLASLAGQVISTTIAVGEITRLMTRSMFEAINHCMTWYGYVTIGDDIRREINFWDVNLDRLNGKSYLKVYDCTDMIFSDASDVGYGGYSVSNPMFVTTGNWDVTEAARSSSWRELRAVLLTLKSFPALRQSCIVWKTDNQAVTRIVHAGSRVKELQEMAVEVFDICSDRSLHIQMQWVPRDQNIIADELSRVVDYDDWYIGLYVFRQLDALWGPHTVDRFSTWYNAHISRFNSSTLVPGTEAVDAFMQTWKGENNWLVPPPRLIAKCVNKIVAEQCKATLIVPMWKSASFWPLLCKDGINFCVDIVDWMDLPTDKSATVKGKANNSIFGGIDLSFRLLALRFV